MPQLQCSERSQSERMRQNQESLVATNIAGDFLRARKTFFTDWAVISKVILSCFSTWVENKMMTTAPSAPATVTPPWLASLSQRQKACPRGEAKAGEAPQGSLLSFCSIQVCTCRSGFQCAMAETPAHRSGGKGQGVQQQCSQERALPACLKKPSSALQEEDKSLHAVHTLCLFHQAITFSHLTPSLGTRQPLALQCPAPAP